MTASAQIGTLRGVPDSASISLESSASLKGAPNRAFPKSNFRSVLEQYHAPRESASQPSAPRQKQKDSDPATAPAVPQQAAPTAEATRLIQPLTTSITLRQDTTSASEETADPDATASSDEATTQNATTAADQKGSGAAIGTISPTPTILRGALGLYSLPRVTDAKTNRAASAKSHAKSKDSVPSQTADAPPSDESADPAIPIRVTSSTNLGQAATVVQNSSTVSEAPYIATASTSERAIDYQFRASNEHPSEVAVSSNASQQQKVSDPTAAVAVPASFAPQPPISNASRQDAKAAASGSQDSSPASGTDLKNALPPNVEPADDTTAASSSRAIAFAARLTPSVESQASVSESIRPADPLPGSQNPSQLATPITAKQIATATDVPADTHSGDSGSQSNREKASDLFAKPDTLLPQIHVAAAGQPAAPANNHAPSSPLSPAAQMNQVIDPPAAAPKTNNDITVRIPDSTGQDTAVRFVERAGEIHVSVRTGDAEMAQSLRGSLNDLVNRLEDGGIRTEVWQPGSASNASASQNDSDRPFADPDGSNGRQYSSGSNPEQESQQQNKPRWVEELESSIGNPNFKETTQLLWQA